MLLAGVPARPIATIPPDHPFPAEERWRLHAEVDVLIGHIARRHLDARIRLYQSVDEAHVREER